MGPYAAWSYEDQPSPPPKHQQQPQQSMSADSDAPLFIGFHLKHLVQSRSALASLPYTPRSAMSSQSTLQVVVVVLCSSPIRNLTTAEVHLARRSEQLQMSL